MKAVVRNLARYMLVLAAFHAQVTGAQDDVTGNLMDFMKPDPRVWKGSITIVRTGSADERQDRSSQGKIDKHYYSRNVGEELRLEVCGTMSNLYVLDLKHTLSDVISEGKDVVQAKTVCEPKGRCTVWKCDREIKHPGDSRRIRKKTIVGLYEGKGPKPMKETASASIQKISGGRYAISAGHNWYQTTSADDVDRQTSACTGKVRVTEQHMRTGGWGQPGGMDTQRTENETITLISVPPVPHMFTMYAEKALDADSGIISGEHTVKSRNGSHGYEEQTVSSWALKGRLPCDDVYFDLRFAIAGADAYSNQEIRDFADNKYEYDSLVDDRMSKILTGRPHTPPGPGQPDSSSDFAMKVDASNCKIIRLDTYRKEQQEACEPEIIFELTLAHEKVHAEHCWGEKHDPPFNANPDTKEGVIATGQTETSAHLAEAQKALGWLQAYCQGRGYDLEGAQARIDAIKARKAGWWD